jgi:glycosyltransferase involved in cell wall biosynthesis
MKKRLATAEGLRGSKLLETSMKTLIAFSTATVEEMIEKGNLWFVRHFEIYFDQVYMVCPFGSPHAPVSQGKTTYISLGKGRFRSDLFFAPFRLYGLAKRVNATSYFTADQFYSWWVFAAVKLLLGARIHLSPDSMPYKLQEERGKSLTGLPMWIERLFIRLSYRRADNVFVSERAGNFTEWVSSSTPSRKRLKLVNSVVHALPSIEFFATLESVRLEKRSLAKKDTVQLLSVGRIHSQKLIDHLIRMLALVRTSYEGLPDITLKLIGEGEERASLQELAAEMGVAGVVEFAGSIPNKDLPYHYAKADIFVSPLTGTSLREAGLCALPVVAYNMDWVKGTFVDEETALLVRPYDYNHMAEQVVRLIRDEGLYEKLSSGIKFFADTNWSPESLRTSLEQTFGLDY